MNLQLLSILVVTSLIGQLGAQFYPAKSSKILVGPEKVLAGPETPVGNKAINVNCLPLVTPYDPSNPLSWPLDNNTFPEPALIPPESLRVADSSLVADYLLRKHNCLRSQAPASNMLKMEWNTEAAAQAQAWADRCIYTHSIPVNRTTSKFTCGQNIGYSENKPVSWNHLANLWYNEVNQYTYGEEATSSEIYGHYTQVDWATTFQLGCGYKDCGGWHYYVCHYCPNGNIRVDGLRQAPYIKGTACTFCPNNCENNLCTNKCEFQDTYSNCATLSARTCRLNNAITIGCKATCNCKGKIF